MSKTANIVETEAAECPKCKGAGHIKRGYDRPKCGECRGIGVVRREVARRAADIRIVSSMEIVADAEIREQRRLRRAANNYMKNKVPRRDWPIDVQEFQRKRDRLKTPRNRRSITIRRDIFEAFKEFIGEGQSLASQVEVLILDRMGVDRCDF